MKEAAVVFNGYAAEKGGASGGEKHCFMLIEGLHKNDFAIYTCCPRNRYSNLDHLITNKSLTYSSIPFEQKYYANYYILFLIYCYRIIASAFKLRRHSRKYTIASSHLFHDIIPLLFIKERCVLITYIYHIISEQSRKGLVFAIIKLLEKASFAIIKWKAILVFVDSERIKKKLVAKYDFKEGNIYLTQNGLDLKDIKDVTNIHESKYDLCFCGRLMKTKGVYDLIEIVNSIKAVFPDISCAIIGDGIEKENLLKVIGKSRLEGNIHLLGFVSEKEKIQIMKSSKIFVFPSHEEGWGIVIGEAMACGLPVVVYRLEDIVGIWGDKVTWVRCYDKEEYSKRIVNLLNDESGNEELTREGEEFAKKLDWSNIIDREIRILMQRV